MSENLPVILVVSNDEGQRLINRNHVKNALDALKADATILVMDYDTALMKVKTDPHPSRYIIIAEARPPKMNGARLFSELIDSIRARTIFYTGAKESLEEALTSMGFGDRKPRILGVPLDADQVKGALSAYL